MLASALPQMLPFYSKSNPRYHNNPSCNFPKPCENPIPQKTHPSGLLFPRSATRIPTEVIERHSIQPPSDSMVGQSVPFINDRITVSIPNMKFTSPIKIVPQNRIFSICDPSFAFIFF